VTNLHIDLQPAGTVFGISTDRSFSHRAFADTEDLAFALLSDSDGSVAESYDVFYEEFNGHKRIAKQSVFVVDTEGTIRYAWSTLPRVSRQLWRRYRRARRRRRLSLRVGSLLYAVAIDDQGLPAG